MCEPRPRARRTTRRVLALLRCSGLGSERNGEQSANDSQCTINHNVRINYEMRKMMSMKRDGGGGGAVVARVKKDRLTAVAPCANARARARWRSDINGYHIFNSLILLKYTRPVA